MDPKFRGGKNIAFKIPKRKYDSTVAFYRDILKLEVREIPISHPTISRSHEVKFGNNLLWLDCVDNYAKPDIWLELDVKDVPAATEYLKSVGINTCDELEALTSNMHWITDPAGNVFLLNQPE